jgi:hypothetical protein
MRHARVFFAGRDDSEEISGADVVVVEAAEGDRWAETIRDRAPNAVVVVVGGTPHKICETTLFPRARIIGVADDAAADAVVDAVVNDLGTEIVVTARCEGERGIVGEFAQVPVRVGASGISEIVEP